LGQPFFWKGLPWLISRGFFLLKSIVARPGKKINGCVNIQNGKPVDAESLLKACSQHTTTNQLLPQQPAILCNNKMIKRGTINNAKQQHKMFLEQGENFGARGAFLTSTPALSSFTKQDGADPHALLQQGLQYFEMENKVLLFIDDKNISDHGSSAMVTRRITKIPRREPSRAVPDCNARARHRR
jgi:hypothetical protein